MSRRYSLGWLAVLLISTPARAADGDYWMLDFFHTHKVRKLLLEDEVLGSINLGVRVRDRVAYLWGPVPTPELALRAEQKLRECIEIKEIRNDLYVEERPVGPLYLPELPGGDPTPPRAPRLAPAPDHTLTRRPSVLPRATFPTQTREVILEPTPMPEVREVELPTLKLPSQALRWEPAPTNLEDQVGTLLRAQNRYQTIQFRVEGPQVFLNAGTGNQQALHEAAQVVAKVPGVRQVILQNPR